MNEEKGKFLSGLKGYGLEVGDSRLAFGVGDLPLLIEVFLTFLIGFPLPLD